MDLMSLFRSSPPKTTPNPDPNLNKDKKDPNDPNNKSGDPNDPNNTANKKEGSPNPLDGFKDLFHTTDSGSASTPPAFQLDQEKLQKLVSSLSFADHVTPELATKLQSGDAVAVKEAFNTLGQSVYSSIFSHLPALTDRYVNARLEHERRGLGGSVKQELTRNSLDKLAASNPVLKQQLEEISARILAKYPDASPDWIADQTQQYFLSVAKALNPKAFSDFKPDPEENKGDHIAGQGNSDTAWADWISGQPKTQPNT